MAELNLSATSRTPAVSLSKAASHLKIEGESYSEDVNGFYRPIMQAVDHYFADGKESLTVEFHLIYFNSSSARAHRIVGFLGRPYGQWCQHHRQMVL